MDRQSVALTPLTGRHVGGLGLQRHLGLGFSLPDRGTVVRFDAVGDDVGALARSWWGIHAESADTPAVHRSVRAVG